ncbi:unnamed protein product [Peniophora sp. CBMAI 1063]|nr:unnamed protein product [Peniophora sp. CBMAI 1063]
MLKTIDWMLEESDTLLCLPSLMALTPIGRRGMPLPDISLLSMALILLIPYTLLSETISSTDRRKAHPSHFISAIPSSAHSKQ